MKYKFKKKLPNSIYFILSIIVISIFFPKEGGFNFTYSEGKPWRYGLLTASFDFPIYKEDAQIQQERDSVLKDFQPYYMLDSETSNSQVSLFKKDAEARSIPAIYMRYVEQELKEIFKAGVVNNDDYENVKKNYQNRLFLRRNDDNINISRHIESLYTSRQAYEKLIDNVPSSLDVTVLRALDLNNYIKENVSLDSETSKKAEQELINSVALANGMVQSGEKIIDRGEIVTSNTYRILNSLEKVSREQSTTKMEMIYQTTGSVILIFLLIAAFMLYLLYFRPREYSSKKQVFFLLLLITSICVITGITVNYKMYSYIYMIPFAIPLILIRTFMDSRTAFTAHLVTSLICAMMVPLPAEFLMLQIPIGFTCIFSLTNLTERSQLLKTSFFIFLTYVVIYTAYVLCQGGTFAFINPKMYLSFGINFVFIMFSYLLVYICEKTFGFLSGVTLVELSNIDKPILRRLSEVAPGTFQHSLQVSNLATSVATRINANATLVRTGALYHDIGKMYNPAFFTENQQPGMSPHDKLTFKESAKIIIGHVTEGVKIAEKEGLPKQIIDFILTHHGKGKTKYFYISHLNKYPDEEVNEADFTYPGPNPFSKETAILMMADSVEAASRSLTEYTEESIRGLIDKLIDSMMSDGLLKNAPITFLDIEIAKDVFFEKLKTIYHTRISYPELAQKEEQTN